MNERIACLINIDMYAFPHVSHSVVSDSVTLWTVAHQSPLSMEFFRQGILEWVAISFSRGSSWPRDWTRVSHIVGRRFTIWDTREVHQCMKVLLQCMKVKSESEAAQSCPILSDPMDCRLPGSCPWDFQARVLEWGAIAFSSCFL